VLPAALPALLFAALAPALPGDHTTDTAPLWDLSVLGKLYVLLSAVATYDLRLDMACALAVLLPLALALVAGGVEAHAGLLLAAAGLIVLALAAPQLLAGTWWRTASPSWLPSRCWRACVRSATRALRSSIA
jgi:hypothetical protein